MGMFLLITIGLIFVLTLVANRVSAKDEEEYREYLLRLDEDRKRKWNNGN